MEDKKLMRISFIILIVGLIILIFASESVEIPEYSIDSKDKYVKTIGKVIKANQNEKIAWIDITIELPIKAILFKPHPMNITPGSRILIDGEIKDDTLIAHKIELING